MASSPQPSDWITQTLGAIDSTIVAVIVAGGAILSALWGAIRILIRLDAVETKQKQTDADVGELKSRIDGLATKDDVGDIKQSLIEIRRTLDQALLHFAPLK